jgi:hypothetical protein
MNSIVNMLLQHCSTVTTWNNMVDNLFVVGRTTLFTPVDINLQQVSGPPHKTEGLPHRLLTTMVAEQNKSILLAVWHYQPLLPLQN